MANERDQSYYLNALRIGNSPDSSQTIEEIADIVFGQLEGTPAGLTPTGITEYTEGFDPTKHDEAQQNQE